MKTPTALLLCLLLLLLPVRARGQETLCAASIFPIWLLVEEVTRDVPGVRTELLLPASTGCPHDYAMSPPERRTLARADILVINGLGLESFLGEGERLKSLMKPGAAVLDASLGLTGLLREGALPNPHLFASPSMSAQMARSLAGQFAALTPEYAQLYLKNGERAAMRLETLAEECRALGSRLKARGVVAQHTIFDYLARDLGLSMEAHIQPHEGQEPSAAEMIGLVRTIRERHAAAVITEPQYPARTGETLAAETGIPCLSLDPVDHGPQDLPQGTALDYYERTMRNNLHTLENCLGSR